MPNGIAWMPDWVRWIFLLLVAVNLALLAFVLFQEATEPEYPPISAPPPPVDALIEITYQEKTITVYPAPANAYRDQKIDWFIAEGKIDIDWKDRNPSELPDPCAAGAAARCTITVPNNAVYGRYYYTVILTTLNGQQLTLDPQVVIQG